MLKPRSRLRPVILTKFSIFKSYSLPSYFKVAECRDFFPTEYLNDLSKLSLQIWTEHMLHVSLGLWKPVHDVSKLPGDLSISYKHFSYKIYSRFIALYFEIYAFKFYYMNFNIFLHLAFRYFLSVHIWILYSARAGLVPGTFPF